MSSKVFVIAYSVILHKDEQRIENVINDLNERGILFESFDRDSYIQFITIISTDMLNATGLHNIFMKSFDASELQVYEIGILGPFKK